MQLSASLVFLSLSLIMGQQTDLCRGGPVQRKSLNQMSQPEIDAFVAAVKAVSNDPANRWGEYAKLHAEVYQGVHVNPKFLPWHRIFVRKMEQFLQEKNPSVTIPYWDWAQYSQNPENDPIFTDRIAGGDGNPGNNDCISNGQFADLKVDYTHDQSSNTRCIKRRMTKKDANGLVWTSSDTIDNMLNSSSFKDFAESIEQGSHGIIHNCIGSEFAGHASPNDPIFYLHHGFIDKIWYDWQKRNPQLANTYSEDANAGLDRLGYRVADALDSEKSVCVSYPEDRFKWNTNQQVPAPQATTTAAPAPAPQTTTAAPVAPVAPVTTTNAPVAPVAPVVPATTTNAPIAPTPNNPNPQPIPSSQPVADQTASPVVQPPVPTTQVVPATTTVPAPVTTDAAIATTIAPVAPVAPVIPQPINNGVSPALSKRGYSVIAPEPYQVKCRSKEARAKYDAWYVHHDIEAPSADDRKDLYKIRVPSQIDNDFIKRWGFNHTLVRQLERKNALFIHKWNKDPNHKSPDALINFPKFNPELKKDDCESKKTTTTNAYPVKPIATTTTTQAYPVKPIATTTTTNAYPVKPIATTTTQAYPVKPIATTTTTNAYPVKPIATTTTTQAYPVKTPGYPVAPIPTTNAYPIKPLPTTEAYPVKPAPTYEAAYPIKQY